MSESSQPLQDLQYIKTMMDRSSRFETITSLAWVLAGLIAFGGAFYATKFFSHAGGYLATVTSRDAGQFRPLLYTGAIAFILATIVCMSITLIRLRPLKGKLLQRPILRLAVNLNLPLFAGAVLLYALYQLSGFEYFAPVSLLMYGLGLFNAGRYSIDAMRYLGLACMALGTIAVLMPAFGFTAWVVGFGVGNLLFGIYQYRKTGF
jgi:hypothetical protein